MSEDNNKWDGKYIHLLPVTIEGYEDFAFIPQCMFCVHYIKLTGKLGSDWGACSNDMSTRDMCIVFEHDVCEFFEGVSNE